MSAVVDTLYLSEDVGIVVVNLGVKFPGKFPVSFRIGAGVIIVGNVPPSEDV